jgi:uncharacterized protein YrzB (UPF0473 family)
MEKNNKFNVIDKDGNEIQCEVLFTFESEETKKNYIVYTDNTKDNKGNIRVFASIYDPNADNSELLPIKSEKEWKIIETILESIQEENNKDNG